LEVTAAQLVSDPQPASQASHLVRLQSRRTPGEHEWVFHPDHSEGQAASDLAREDKFRSWPSYSGAPVSSDKPPAFGISTPPSHEWMREAVCCSRTLFVH